MANYFNYFPKTLYSLSDEKNSVDVITNIISRFKFDSELKDNSSLFYPYEIQDGDTPEIIANKYYGSPEKHWVVLMFNDIIDPQYDWPLDQRTITKFINDKYAEDGANALPVKTGLAWSQQNTKKYFKVVTRSTNNNTKDVIKEKMEIDSNTYTDLVQSTDTYTLKNGVTVTQKITKETQSYYDYEIEQNESKRKIKLLRSEYVSQSGLMDEFKRVINNKD